MFPGALLIHESKGLRHASDTVDGSFKLLTKLAAEPLALALVISDGRLDFRFGLGMDREWSYGYCSRNAASNSLTGRPMAFPARISFTRREASTSQAVSTSSSSGSSDHSRK
jgi:hypothetical protein